MSDFDTALRAGLTYWGASVLSDATGASLRIQGDGYSVNTRPDPRRPNRGPQGTRTLTNRDVPQYELIDIAADIAVAARTPNNEAEVARLAQQFADRARRLTAEDGKIHLAQGVPNAARTDGGAPINLPSSGTPGEYAASLLTQLNASAPAIAVVNAAITGAAAGPSTAQQQDPDFARQLAERDARYNAAVPQLGEALAAVVASRTGTPDQQAAALDRYAAVITNAYDRDPGAIISTPPGSIYHGMNFQYDAAQRLNHLPSDGRYVPILPLHAENSPTSFTPKELLDRALADMEARDPSLSTNPNFIALKAAAAQRMSTMVDAHTAERDAAQQPPAAPGAAPQPAAAPTPTVPGPAITDPAQIRQAQMMLQRLGLNTGDGPRGNNQYFSSMRNAATDNAVAEHMDGNIGRKTKEALHTVQRALGLPESDTLTPEVAAVLNDPARFAQLNTRLHGGAATTPPPAPAQGPITLNATGQEIGAFMATIVQQTPFGPAASAVSQDNIISMSTPERADLIEAAFGSVAGVTKDHRFTISEAAAIEARLNTPQASDDPTKLAATRTAFEAMMRAAGIDPAALPQLAQQNANREIQIQSTPAGAAPQGPAPAAR